MGIADSPLRDRVIFVQGAPRSGTTLLTTLLSVHPNIAGIASETHLFDLGVDRLIDNHELSEGWQRYLVAYVSRQELIDLIRDLCDGILELMRTRIKPEAEFVLEKTPVASTDPEKEVRTKVECYPDAWYVHIVREGRAVAESLERAPWADERSSAAGQQTWRRAIDAIRGQLGAHPRYREFRYEDLSADPVGVTSQIFKWLRLGVDDATRERVRLLAKDRYAAFEPAPSPVLRRRRPVKRLPGEILMRFGRWLFSSTGRRRPRFRRRNRSDPARSAAAALARAMRENDASGLDNVTSRSFEVELRSGAGDMRATGDKARLAALELGAEVFRRKFASESWAVSPGARSIAMTFSGVAGDATRVDLCLNMVVTDAKVTRLYVLSAGDPAGRPLREWRRDDG